MSTLSEDNNTVFMLYRVNRSVEASSLSQNSGVKSDNMFVFDGHLIRSVDTVVTYLNGEYPAIEAYLKVNSTRLIELCQSGWMLRLIEVSCKEQSMGRSIVDIIHFQLFVCFKGKSSNTEIMFGFP